MKNRPLTREQIKKLPVRKTQLVSDGRGGLKEKVLHSGFTVTALFPTTRERNIKGKPNPYGYNNRKSGRGRVVQWVPETVPVETKFGTLRQFTGKYRKVHHATAARLFNK